MVNLRDYPTDTPFPSRLVLGWVDARPLHVVVVMTTRLLRTAEEAVRAGVEVDVRENGHLRYELPDPRRDGASQAVDVGLFHASALEASSAAVQGYQPNLLGKPMFRGVWLQK